MPWCAALRPARELDMRKASLSVIGASWVQIAVAVALAVMYFVDESVTTGVLIVALVPVVILGNALLMRNSWVILSFLAQMEGIRSTLEGEAEINRQMRAQRHDFINHLQVVYSLLQLDEHREAEEYLRRVYEDIRQVGRLLRTENPAVNALLAAKSVQAEQRHIRLSFSIRSRLDRLPMEDWEFCRVLGNLIDNALDAANGQNEPWTAVALWEELADFRFQVSNNGPVVPRELAARIFEPGFTTKGDRGSGMGLYIVRTLLQKYGGAIHVESDDEKTVFSGRIPVQAIEDRNQAAEPNVQNDS